MRISGIQKCLPTEAKPLTLKKALEVTVTVDSATQNTKELQRSGNWNRFHQHIKTKGLATDEVKVIHYRLTQFTIQNWWDTI